MLQTWTLSILSLAVGGCGTNLLTRLREVQPLIPGHTAGPCSAQGVVFGSWCGLGSGQIF